MKTIPDMISTKIGTPTVAGARRNGMLIRTMMCCALLCSAAFMAMAQKEDSIEKVPARVEVLRFKLSLKHMDPAEITVPAGKYVLEVENGVTVSPVAFELENLAKQKVKPAKEQGASSRRQMVLDLQQGTYRLYAPAYQTWSTTITVTAKKDEKN